MLHSGIWSKREGHSKESGGRGCRTHTFDVGVLYNENKHYTEEVRWDVDELWREVIAVRKVT